MVDLWSEVKFNSSGWMQTSNLGDDDAQINIM